MIGHCPAKQKVGSLIPGQGTCLVAGFVQGWSAYGGNQLRFLSHIDVFLLSFSLPHPLSKNKKIKSLKKFTFCPMAYQAGCGPSYLAALTPCAPASHLLSALCPLKDLSPAAPSAQVASPLTHLLPGYLSFFEVHGNVSFLERPYLTAPFNMCLTFPLPSFSISVIFSL